MTVKCPNCEWSAEVPDEKIPAGNGKGTCPKCQTKFEVHKDAKPLIEEPPVLSPSTRRDTRACPLCGEEILSVAKKCKHCQSMIDDAKEEEILVTQSNQDNQCITNFTLFCPKCQSEQPVSDICIKCGVIFSKLAKAQPIKGASLESCSGTMLWDSEDDNFICVKCPKCSKESRIRKGAVLKTGTDCYSGKGSGTCSCGFPFDRIKQQNNYGSSHIAMEQYERQLPIQSHGQGGTKIISCPNCGSTQISASKQGFGLGLATVGGLLLGPLGLLAGLKGIDGTTVTCLNCGHGWEPGLN